MSVDVYVPEGSPQGTRFVQLWTGDTLLASKSFTVVTGLNKLPLGFQVPTGQHSIRCPQGNLFRNTGLLQYPYPIGSVGQVVTSSFGNQYYYDFFNWKIKTRDVDCISTRQEINVLISGEHDNSTLSEEIIYPNPTTGILHVNLAGSATRLGVLHLWDSSGVKLISKKINDESIINMDIGHMASGLYYLQCSSESSSKMMKVIKI
jgi:hypothetical protein